METSAPPGFTPPSTLTSRNSSAGRDPTSRHSSAGRNSTMLPAIKVICDDAAAKAKKLSWDVFNVKTAMTKLTTSSSTPKSIKSNDTLNQSSVIKDTAEAKQLQADYIAAQQEAEDAKKNIILESLKLKLKALTTAQDTVLDEPLEKIARIFHNAYAASLPADAAYSLGWRDWLVKIDNNDYSHVPEKKHRSATDYAFSVEYLKRTVEDAKYRAACDIAVKLNKDREKKRREAAAMETQVQQSSSEKIDELVKRATAPLLKRIHALEKNDRHSKSGTGTGSKSGTNSNSGNGKTGKTGNSRKRSAASDKNKSAGTSSSKNGGARKTTASEPQQGQRRQHNKQAQGQRDDGNAGKRPSKGKSNNSNANAADKPKSSKASKHGGRRRN